MGASIRRKHGIDLFHTMPFEGLRVVLLLSANRDRYKPLIIGNIMTKNPRLPLPIPIHGLPSYSGAAITPAIADATATAALER